MKTKPTPSIVITGAASGIGRALALECRDRGFIVYATDLRAETMADMKSPKLHALKLDVNSAADIKSLLRRLAKDAVVPDLLVNNAGFGAVLPMLDMPLERLRLQFETNVFSVVALCQAIAPGMIARGSGTIVNIGSVSGVMTTPFAGAYCATKAAVHALSDALRMELKPFGLKVVTVMPGGIRTNFGNAAASGVAKNLKADSLYAPIADAIAARAVMSQDPSITPEQFASQMMDAVLRRSTPPVIGIGPGGSVVPWVKRLVPLVALDRALSAKFKLGRLRA
ncbi:MAG: SDR family NAD(P)-dependent oxidoreductase [Pseudomonadota bacterium]